jgi:uncharacterized protein (TIGR01244 family)
MRQITKDFFVAGQIQAGDMAALKAAGITLVINNRPDGEDFGQPAAAEIESAVCAAGLAYCAIPVVSGAIDTAAVVPTRHALSSATGPVLAFCRSGARSTALWAMAQCSAGSPVADVVDLAAYAGYDLSSLVPLFHQLQNTAPD